MNESTLFQILKEEIGPKLAKLKEEKTQYVEFQRIERELDHCKRIYLAWRYVTALSECQNAEENVQNVKNKIEDKKKNISAGDEELKNIEKELDEMAKKRDAVCILDKNVLLHFLHFLFIYLIFIGSRRSIRIFGE